LRVELLITREEAKSSRAWLEALRNSIGQFQVLFEGFAALSKTFGDKIFLAMSNLYFFNQLRGV
jgi:hypothetical protein